MEKKKITSMYLNYILVIWREKEACYINGEYNSDVSMALFSNSIKLISKLLFDYKENIMDNDVKILIGYIV